jgi:ornithine cyclodeaminase
MIWGRNKENAIQYKDKLSNTDFSIKIASTIEELTSNCNTIITTPPSTKPLLFPKHIKAGTHITAIGSDTADKIELSPQIIEKADIVVADSFAQSFSRGEIFQARQNDEFKLVELGNLIQDPTLGRTNEQQITVADLTGVAVQDIMIATAIFNHHKNLTK